MLQFRRAGYAALIPIALSTAGCGVDDRGAAQALLDSAEMESAYTIEARELNALPEPVRRFLLRSNIVGKKHLRAVRARGSGEIVLKGESMPIEFEQYTTTAGRSWFVRGSMNAVMSMTGHDSYRDGRGRMSIRLNEMHFQETVGPEMDRSALVTLLSELVSIPTAFARVEWAPVDDRSARASITDAGVTVSGICAFDDAGDLVEFTSDDRYQTQNDGTQENVRWSAPGLEIGELGGLRTWLRAGGVWHEKTGPRRYVEVRFRELDQDIFETY